MIRDRKLFPTIWGGYKIIMIVTIIIIIIAIILMFLSYFTKWEFTGIVDNEKYKTVWDWVDLLFIPVIIAIAGALCAKSQQRNDWTLKIRDDYDRKYITISIFYRYCEDDGKREFSNREKNMMLRLGNWMEIVATLYNRNYVNRKLIHDIGIDQSVCDFYEKAKNASFLEHGIKAWDELFKFYDGRSSK